MIMKKNFEYNKSINTVRNTHIQNSMFNQQKIDFRNTIKSQRHIGVLIEYFWSTAKIRKDFVRKRTVRCSPQ